MKKSFSPQQKATVAFEAIRGSKSASEIASTHTVHPTQIRTWKEHPLAYASTLFTDKRTKDGKTQERLIDDLYKTIGQRDMELEWLKKSLQRFDP